MKNAAKNKATKKKAAADTTSNVIDPGFAPIVEAFARDREVTQGKMFGSVGLKVKGKVFAMLVKGSFVAKLPKERVDALVVDGGATYFDPGHGKPMKEWVSLSASKSTWVELAREAYRYVSGGKP
jgi:TfoX/Sxy family transcriptional regulator of competence genes